MSKLCDKSVVRHVILTLSHYSNELSTFKSSMNLVYNVIVIHRPTVDPFAPFNLHVLKSKFKKNVFVHINIYI